MMTITYPVSKGIYVNITNRCPCACTFCIRNHKDHVFESDTLWLDREPAVQEICDSLDTWNLEEYEEIVFCGFGEPTVRLYDLLEVARYVKSKSDIKIRINTNGLADLIWNKSTASELKGFIDTVSVSLNATNKEDYLKVVRPRFGIESFDAMLKFTKECTEYVPSVIMTVVDVVTTKEEQETCRKICESVGATFRVRPYSD
ncbi:MAG: TIGR04100 family radical SAM protein [Acutalibacteraceae bacterium]|nr:TIGR04100 family radical SAM protein [Acutalibacteraceae bacterium]